MRQQKCAQKNCSIPEQKAEVKAKVYGSLYNAVKNYQTIRMSTGMSIKELFDYAIKNAHGTLPKASYVPPTFGYVTPNSKAAGGANGVDPTGNKRIYFENKISSLYENLLKEELPQKTVNFEQLEKEFSNALKEKPVVKLNVNSAKDFEMIYPSVDAEFEKLYGPAYFEFLKEYFYSIENKAERSFDDDSGIFARSAVIKPVFRQVEVLEKSSASFAKNATSDFSGERAAVNDERTAQQKLGSSKSAAAGGKTAAMSDIFSRTVVLPENLHTVKAKKRASGLLEDTFVVQFRENNAASKNQNAESAVQNNNSGALSENEQEPAVTVLLKNMKNDERVELLGVVNNDESLLTPLLIKEYLWRKQNKKSVSGLLNDVSDVEKVQKFNSSQLEGLYKLLGVKNNALKNASESAVAGTSQNVLSGEVSKTSLGGGIADFAGKGFATKGFAAGESGDFGNLGQNYAQSAETAAAIALASGSESVAPLAAQDTPVMISTKAKHLSLEKSEVLKSQYDMNLSWFSPVLMSYIANKEWITGSANSSAGGTKGFEESLFANTNANASSDAASAGVTPKAQNMTVQKIAVNPAKKFELEEKSVVPNKKEYKTVAKKNLSPEEQRMARINANYEKDRAALAKTDPAFMAKNQFFDVGHAEGSGELLGRQVDKLTEKRSNDLFNDVQEI